MSRLCAFLFLSIWRSQYATGVWFCIILVTSRANFRVSVEGEGYLGRPLGNRTKIGVDMDVPLRLDAWKN